MNQCPCCSNSMLRHFRNHQTYWFCRSCWQEMPLLDSQWDNESQRDSINLMPLKLELNLLSPQLVLLNA